MKKFNFCWFSLLFLTLSPIVVSASPADSVIGKWYTENRRGIMEFYLKGNELCARTYPLKKDDMLDVKNPVDSLRNRKVAGLTIVHGLKYNPSNKKWENGRVYNPENGKTYYCWCRFEEGKLQFRGYLKVEVLGKTEQWTRIE